MNRTAFHVLVVALALAPSCKVKAVDLGDDQAPVDASPPPADAPDDVSDAGTTTLEDRLRALCKEGMGSPDRYGSALELTSRLVGRWYLCDDPSLSPIGDRSGVELGADGRWVVLDFDAAREKLVPSTNPDQGGMYEYTEAAVGPDGGDAGPKVIARDDATTRGGLFVALHRAVSTDIVVVVDFEKPPRRMLLRNAGASKNAAFYVAIP